MYFVISNNKNQFIAIDDASGGYLYWSSYIRNAKIFTDLEKVKEFIEYEIPRFSYLDDESIHCCKLSQK